MPFRRAVALALAFYTALYCVVFARGLLSGGPLAYGDSQFEYLPQFAHPNDAWTPLLFSGYPLIADPQNATFSLTRLLFSAAGWWSPYALSALVIASTTAFAYALEVTGSCLGALVAGIVFGASGYMLRNFHLTPMLQTTAWIPLVLWAIERLVRERRGWVVFVGAGALAMAVCGGYFQPTAYTFVIAGAYALVGLARAKGARREFAVLAGATFLGGLGLSAVQLVPTAELFTLSGRTTMPFEQFSGWSWQPLHALELFVPRAFLGRWATLAASAACNIATDADHTYFSLLAMALAGLGAFYTRRTASTRFWIVVLIFSLVFAFGDRTPLAKLVYHFPPYNKFRGPVRHMVFFALGLAVLAAHAVAVIEKRFDRRPVFVALGALGGALAVALGLATRGGCVTLGSAASIASVVAFCAAAVALLVWAHRPHARAAQAGVLTVVVVDLATFDGVGYERPTYGAHPLAEPAYFQLTPHAAALARELGETKQRLFSIRGAIADRDEIPVNANLLWRVPSAAGYSPIAPTRSLDSVGAAYFGAPIRTWWSPDDRSLDVAAVRYVTLPDPTFHAFTLRGIHWHPADLGLRVDADSPELVVGLPPGSFGRLAIVADLWASMAIAEDTLVATIDGVELRAGRDVSEWSVDCPEIVTQMKHGRADVIESRPVQTPGGACPWNRYFVERGGSFDGTLRIRWQGGAPGVLRIHRLTVGDVPVVPEVLAVQADPRWRVRATPPGTLVAENQRALSRAYVVGEAIAVPRAIDVVRSGALPTGQPWDPRVAVLRESGVTERLDPRCASATVRWLLDATATVELEVGSPALCYLVLADTAYPGWHATVDGTEIPIERVNGNFRGVYVPAGAHRVRFDFVPRSLHVGAAVSLVTLAVFAGALTRRRLLSARQGKPRRGRE